MSGKQMCETISHVWRVRDGRDVAPERIWRYSPSGELFMIWGWFEDAAEWLTSA